MEYSEQLKQLLTLGEQKFADLNYSGLGFSAKHADELIRMATDPELLETEYLATVHAWYALGQLKVTEAIAPLLDFREQYPLDLLFDEELPKAIALMGESAIPVLKQYLFDGTREENDRSNALPCLEEICLTYRQECLEVFNELLQQSDQSSKSLAGLAICALIDLKATETIEVIRDTFKRDCVNIAIPGDLEDVEIAFGLRTKRDTPTPDYNDFPPEMTKAIDTLLKLAKPASKVGRNNPCPCGSGKKFKKCCLQ